MKFGGFCYIEKDVIFDRFPKNVFIGRGATIKKGTIICPCNHKARIEIGANTTIGYWSLIFASEKISIGDNCLVAPRAHILDSNHRINRLKLIREQENSVSPVIIEEDVWLGSGVTVLKASKIGRGCVIGANSIVSGELESYAIYSSQSVSKIGMRHE